MEIVAIETRTGVETGSKIVASPVLFANNPVKWFYFHMIHDVDGEERKEKCASNGNQRLKGEEQFHFIFLIGSRLLLSTGWTIDLQTHVVDKVGSLY